jgi:hypothetical protein
MIIQKKTTKKRIFTAALHHKGGAPSILMNSSYAVVTFTYYPSIGEYPIFQ